MDAEGRYSYHLVRSIHSLGGEGQQEVYSIDAWDKVANQRVCCHYDISPHREPVERLAGMMTEGDLDLMHMEDVVDDFLNDQLYLYGQEEQK